MVSLSALAGPLSLVGLTGVAGFVIYKRMQQSQAGDASAAISTVITQGGAPPQGGAEPLYSQPPSKENAPIQPVAPYTAEAPATAFVAPSVETSNPVMNNSSQPPVETGDTAAPTISYYPGNNYVNPAQPSSGYTAHQLAIMQARQR